MPPAGSSHIACDYYVYVDPDDGNKYKARNGLTGAIDFVDPTNAEVVMNGVINTLSSGSVISTVNGPGRHIWSGGQYGKIFVGPGVFNVASSIVLKSNIRIEGCGPWATRFKLAPGTANTNNSNVFKSSMWDSRHFQGASLTTEQLRQGDIGIQLSHFSVDGNKVNNPAVTTVVATPGAESWGHGIVLYGGSNWIDDVSTQFCVGAGIITQFAGVDWGTFLSDSPNIMHNIDSVNNGQQGFLARCAFHLNRFGSAYNGEAGLDIQNCGYFFSDRWYGTNMLCFFDGTNHGGQLTTVRDPLGFGVRLNGGPGFISNSWIEGPFGSGDSLMIGIDNVPATSVDYTLQGLCGSTEITNCYFDFPRQAAIYLSNNATVINIHGCTILGPANRVISDSTHSRGIELLGASCKVDVYTGGFWGFPGQYGMSIGGSNNSIKYTGNGNLQDINWESPLLKNNTLTAQINTPSAAATTPITGSPNYFTNAIFIQSTGSSTNPALFQNGGLVTLTGNGSQLTFTIAHGLYVAPNVVSVIANTASAATPFSVIADGTNITITYITAPVAGSFKLWWNARVSPQ
ncbi:MAG: hypothetical protein M3044_01110 [Thermoproteota archaeon]|nr:hypothetical protein [Thermoproteota archaeon]